MAIKRSDFDIVLLDEGQTVNGECPECGKWVSEFPDIELRPYKGEKSKVSKWDFWNCAIQFTQVESY